MHLIENQPWQIIVLCLTRRQKQCILQVNGNTLQKVKFKCLSRLPCGGIDELQTSEQRDWYTNSESKRSSAWALFSKIVKLSVFKSVFILILISGDSKGGPGWSMPPVGCLRGGERGTCLGPPLFGGPPLRCYACKFSLYLVKKLLSTQIMYYKADHK